VFKFPMGIEESSDKHVAGYAADRVKVKVDAVGITHGQISKKRFPRYRECFACDRNRRY